MTADGVAKTRSRRQTKADSVKPRQVEPGEMKRGKLFRLDKGWVFVSPSEMGLESLERLREWWALVSTDPIIAIDQTDLMVGENGHLFVKDVAFAFPEKEITDD